MKTVVLSYGKPTAPFDIDHLAVLLLVAVEPDICVLLALAPQDGIATHTRDKDIPVMCHEVLDDLGRTIDNVHIPPVNPAVLWFQRSV